MSGFKFATGVAALALVAVVGMASSPVQVAGSGNDMLYLVEFEATEAGAPTTQAQALELLEQLIVPSLERLAANGTVRAGGLHVGARSGVFVVGAKSHDAVTELVRALPAWGVWNWKVQPLESFGHRASLEKRMVKMLKGEGR